MPLEGPGAERCFRLFLHGSGGAGDGARLPHVSNFAPKPLTFVVEWYGKLRTFAKNLEFREALIRG